MEYDSRPRPIPSSFHHSVNHRRQSQRASAVLISPGPSPQVQIPSIPPSIPPLSVQPRQSLIHRSLGVGSTEDFTLVAVDQQIQQSRQPNEFPNPQRPSLDTANLPSSSDSSVPRDYLTPDSATEPQTSRQSSRRALTEALRLAQEAVLLDSQNDDPIAAFRAYARSVTLLNEVMERVLRGDRDTDSRRRAGRVRSDMAREDEARRLKSIHDTYAERMRILAEMYEIPDEMPSTVSLPTPSPIIRHTPANTVTVHENSSQSFDAFAISSDAEDSSPSTPTLSDRQFASTESLRNTYISTNSSGPATEYIRMRSNSPTLQSSMPARAANPVVGRVSYLPPPRPPPNGPPPLRPRAASASAQAIISSFSDNDRKSIPSSSNGDPDLIMRESLISTASDLHFTQYALDNVESPPLPPVPESSSSSAPQTPRSDLREPNSITSPENTPRQNTSSTPISQQPNTSKYRSQLNKETGISPQTRLVNQTTVEGTISQRRNKTSLGLPTALPASIPAPPKTSLPLTTSQTNLPMVKLTSAIGDREHLQFGNRSRAVSQPGIRPPLIANYSAPTGREGGIPPPPALAAPLTATPMPPPPPKSTHLSPLQTQDLRSPPLNSRQSSLPTVPTSPLPPPSPSDPIRKPYHLMSLLRLTMTSRTGGYITRKLHVPHEVWSQGGAKLSNLPEKVKVVEVLCSALEELQIASAELYGVESSNQPPLANPQLRKAIEKWINKLEEWSNICEGVVGNLGKKLGIGEGFAAKKASSMTSWSTKFSRSLDKFTNGKNLDSPAAYVTGLTRLFQQAQLLDDHSKALNSPPTPPTIYTSLPAEARALLQSRLKQSSEFFATVVLTFVIRDLYLLLDKYAKKGGQWLSE